MNIQIKETRVASYKPTRFWVNITLQIKDEDITKADKELLELLRRDWTSLVSVIQSFQTEEETVDPRKKKITELIMCMNEYATKYQIDIVKLKKQLYITNNVTSRANLTLEQLQTEIDSFRNWIKYNNQ